MKKLSYLLLIPVLLSGCSQEEVIVPETTPSVTETPNIPTTTPSSEATSPDLSPDTTPPELSSQTLSAETIHYLTQCSLFLEEVDAIYRSMGEYFEGRGTEDTLIFFENYLTEIKHLVDLLEQTQDLIPTHQVQTEHNDFITSSLALAEYYKQVYTLLKESDLLPEKQWLLLESTFPDLLPIYDDFSNSAFELMVGLGQGNLAG